MGKNALALDYRILAVFLFLFIGGLVFMVSTTFSSSQEIYGSTTYILFHQLKFGVLPGIVLGLICFFVPLHKIRKLSFLGVAAALLLTALVFVPGVGVNTGGALRWVSLGPFSFQPSEFLKIAFIVYLAAWISSKKKEGSEQRKGINFWNAKDLTVIFLPFLAILFVIGLILYCQPDISTLGVIVITAFLMFFAAKTRPVYTVLLVCGGIAAFAFFVSFSSYRLERMFTFLNQGSDPMGKGYQINQSLISIGSGGWFGKGIGVGMQKFGFLPHPASDSIFAVLGEETGFIGSFLLVSAFFLFAWFGLKAAKAAKDDFSRMLAVGIVSWITLQAFIHMGAMVEIMPLTGIPLPFISYGGSHLIAEFMAAGILLNVSKKNLKI
jgi:cell division protein FtsW